MGQRRPWREEHGRGPRESCRALSIGAVGYNGISNAEYVKCDGAMRMWMDPEGRLLTDEQLLRLIAYRGSLEDALAQGNIRLVSSLGERSADARPEKRRRKLADYLEEG